jgi:hypothetical protein
VSLASALLSRIFPSFVVLWLYVCALHAVRLLCDEHDNVALTTCARVGAWHRALVERSQRSWRGAVCQAEEDAVNHSIFTHSLFCVVSLPSIDWQGTHSPW